MTRFVQVTMGDIEYRLQGSGNDAGIVNTFGALMERCTCEYALLKTHSTASHGSLIGKPLWSFGQVA